MDKQAEDIMTKVAGYIETTQSQLDSHNENRTAFVKRANQVAGVLANRGLIAHTDINAFVDKVAADATGEEVWALVEKLASAICVDELGEAVREKMAAAGAELGPFEKLALYGDARAEVPTSGMLD